MKNQRLSVSKEDRYSYWSDYLRPKANYLTKNHGIPKQRALDLLAQVWRYKDWEELVHLEYRWKSFYPNVYRFDKGEDFHKKLQTKELKWAASVFRFEPPMASNFYSYHIIDFIRSASAKAILPVLDDVNMYMRKEDQKHAPKGFDQYLEGGFLYIEAHDRNLGKANTRYFIQMLRDIWECFPEMKFYLSWHGFNANYDDPELKTGDWIDYGQLRNTVKVEQNLFGEWNVQELIIKSPF